MKPYGNTRKDNITCGWGCCVSNYCARRGDSLNPRARRRGRKRARREDKKITTFTEN